MGRGFCPVLCIWQLGLGPSASFGVIRAQWADEKAECLPCSPAPRPRYPQTHPQECILPSERTTLSTTKHLLWGKSSEPKGPVGKRNCPQTLTILICGMGSWKSPPERLQGGSAWGCGVFPTEPRTRHLESSPSFVSVFFLPSRAPSSSKRRAWGLA